MSGAFDVPTRAAITQYRDLTNQLPPPGSSIDPSELDPVTARNLLREPPCPDQFATFRERKQYSTPEKVSTLKSKLCVAETDRSNPPMLDEATREAVKKLQRENQMPETGIIDKKLAKLLFELPVCGAPDPLAGNTAEPPTTTVPSDEDEAPSPAPANSPGSGTP